MLTAAAEETLRKLLTFHSRVVEAEATAAGIVDAAARLREADPQTYPAPERVWASWLHGHHPPARRQAVLASDVIEHRDGERGLLPAALRVLASVKVLGEGVDTIGDSIAFGDVRGSMVFYGLRRPGQDP